METTLEGVSVLVIDDDTAVLDSLANALASEGIVVSTAKDCAEGLSRFAGHHPDLVLLDLNLPGGGGWNVFEEVSRWAPEVPVVIITAQPGQFHIAREACVAALVEKPISIPTLLETMMELLGEKYETRLSRLTHRGPGTRRIESRHD